MTGHPEESIQNRPRARKGGVVREYIDFLRHTKKWWLLPILLVLLLFGFVVVSGGGAASVVYTLF